MKKFSGNKKVEGCGGGEGGGGGRKDEAGYDWPMVRISDRT